MKETVFIAGPMSTSGEPGENLHLAAKAAARLIREGFIPFVPHVAFLLHAIAPEVAAAQWSRWSLAWVERCDILLRLAGASVGADREVERARGCGLRVYTSMDELIFQERPGGGR